MKILNFIQSLRSIRAIENSDTCISYFMTVERGFDSHRIKIYFGLAAQKHKKGVVILCE